MSSQREEKLRANVCLPEGLSVLVVDADSVSLDKIIEMCRRCSYEVMATTKALKALSILREARNKFDIVIIDINIHDINPFEFINIVSLDTDLPLVVASVDDNDTVVKAFINGATDVLLKPIRIDNIKVIWKNVLLKQNCNMGHSKTEPKINDCQKHLNLLDSDTVNPIDYRNVISESSSSSRVGKDDEDTHKKEITQKKQRKVWTPQLHAKFVAIVDQIGVKNAVPKKILEMMNEHTLTRENVASHLQKFRLYLRKSEQSKQQKRQMQSHAVNLEFNAQTYSYNSQNQFNLDPTKFQHLMQNPANSFGYISQLNQISPEKFSVTEPIFGLQYDNVTSSTSKKFNEFSGFCVGETCDLESLDNSLLLQRPIKIRKLNHDVSIENLSDEYWHSGTTLPLTTDNDSSSLSSTFGENTFFSTEY